MKYGIEITRRASRDLAAVPAPSRKRIARTIDGLAVEPRPSGCCVRCGDYRVIYEVRDEVLLVLVIMVRPRGAVYGDLQRLLRGR